MQPLFVIKKLPALCKVLPEMLVSQAELPQNDRGAVCPEAATVQPHVQQPIVFVVRLLSRRVQQISPSRILLFNANLCFERPNLVKLEDLYAFELDVR